jgi:hypothetical protein
LGDVVASAIVGGDDRLIVLETCAAAAAKAVISRVAGSTVSVLVARAQDKRALQKALREALARTDAKHGALLGRYEVNVGLFEHEGANELALVLLPGPGPDARRMARTYHRSLGIEEGVAQTVVSSGGFKTMGACLRTSSGAIVIRSCCWRRV